MLKNLTIGETLEYKLSQNEIQKTLKPTIKLSYKTKKLDFKNLQSYLPLSFNLFLPQAPEAFSESFSA